MTNNNNIALIFFSRNKSDEAKHKSWFREPSKNQQLAEILIERTKSAIRASGIPVYSFNEENQKGVSFGERIANAYHEIFELGFEHVISVGNDCPDLPKIDWNEICQILQSGQSVLGPDKRGGAYLIGIQKAHFDKCKFEKLSWQKNTLYEELSLYCDKSSTLMELKSLRDINSYHDIKLLTRARDLIDNLKQLVSLLLNPPYIHLLSFQPISHDFYIYKDSPLRAPPIL